MGQLFGTDGVRGVANVAPMNSETALQLGRGLAYVLRHGDHRPKIVIGKDTRLSGYMIENAIASGICSMGADVLLVGPLPTPGIAFITHSMRADAGVVISASHNPYEDNGIKFFSGQGFKLPDELEERIERLVLGNHIDHLRPTADKVGKAFRVEDARGRYIVYLKSTFPRELSLEGLKIALDCAHGAAYKVAPAVFWELGAELVQYGVEPTGRNINENCGAVHPQTVCRMVKETGAHLGIALDGDADRAIMVDETGDVVDGDEMMAIAADDLMQRGRLSHNTLCATVMSNLGLEKFIEQRGGRMVRTRVGDRYVVEEMRRSYYNLGGEQSGHVIFLDHSTTGDGILTALQVIAVMLREDKPLSELKKLMTRYPQILVNVTYKRALDEAAMEKISELSQGAEKELGNSGRVLIRPSGTEPKMRIMVEGEDEAQINKVAEGLAGEIENILS